MNQAFKFNRNLFSLLFIAFAFVSCEKEEMQEDLSLDMKARVNTATEFGSISYSSSEVCLGNSVTVTFDNDQGHDHGGFHLQVWGPNDLTWVNVNGALSAPSGGQVTYTFEPAFIGDYNFRGMWNRQGGSGVSISWIDATTPLSVVSNCCVDNLEAVLTCGTTRTLSLSFTAEEDGAIVIQGGLTSGTTILNATSNVLTRNLNHNSAGGPSNVTRWEGNVTACEEVTITIEFTGGEGVGDWSAKRGDDVLGTTQKMSCE